MRNLKSYEEFLFEASKAKEIEDKVNDLGEPKDDKAQMDKEMKDSSEGPKEVGAEKGDVKKDELTKDDKAAADKSMKDSSEGPTEPEEEELKEGKGAYEKHDKYDDRLVNMTIGSVLDYLKSKDPDAYNAIEGYLEKNFKDLTSADESWFTTMTA
jgi:hypothetical protein